MEISGTIKKLGDGAWSAREDSIGASLYSVIEVDEKPLYNVVATDLISSYLREGNTSTLLLFRTLNKRYLVALKNQDGRVVTALQSFTFGTWLKVIGAVLLALVMCIMIPQLALFLMLLMAYGAYVILQIKKFEAKHR